MADTGWVAFGGVAAGVIVKGLWDWMLAVGKVRADREARAEARRDKRAERRDDLQRQTLLDLQQAAFDLARATTQGDTYDRAARREHRPWGSLCWPAEIAEKSNDAFARMRLLSSRLHDDTLREAATALAIACMNLGNAAADEKADQRKDEGIEMFSQVQERAGRLIREMDGL